MKKGPNVFFSHCSNILNSLRSPNKKTQTATRKPGFTIYVQYNRRWTPMYIGSNYGYYFGGPSNFSLINVNKYANNHWLSKIIQIIQHLCGVYQEGISKTKVVTSIHWIANILVKWVGYFQFSNKGWTKTGLKTQTQQRTTRIICMNKYSQIDTCLYYMSSLIFTLTALETHCHILVCVLCRVEICMLEHPPT